MDIFMVCVVGCVCGGGVGYGEPGYFLVIFILFESAEVGQGEFMGLEKNRSKAMKARY
jgi:hypothetical protein